MPREKRTWVYVMRPAAYEMAPCDCGNADPEWSECTGHLWCAVCQKDFVPKHGGIFSGPIPVNGAAAMGLSFSRINLATGLVEEDPNMSEPCFICGETGTDCVCDGDDGEEGQNAA